MTLGAFLESSPAPGSETTPSGVHQRVSSTVQAQAYGAAVSYSQANVSIGDTITAAKWNSIMGQARDENNRRGKSGTTFSLSTNISALDYNSIISLFNVGDSRTDEVYNDGAVTKTTWGPTAAPSVPSDVAAGSTITASQLNTLIQRIKDAGSVCTCNCNYCTCNCNYCTCNCNYSCTCNCNYSDKRLKKNIKHVDTVDGINVYEYNYLWNEAKRFVGVIAQELVGTKYEKALMQDSNGFYAVDYSLLPVNFKEV